MSSYESAQELRKKSSLKASREQLAICARPVCPKALSADCTKWLEEVQNSIPTVVIEGRDTSGGETVAIRVTVDGKVLAERLDGRALEVDPGPHAFRYEYGGQNKEEQVVIREGERNRKLVVSFAKTPPAGTAAPTASTPTTASPRPTNTSPPPTATEVTGERRPVRPITYALGGVSLLGFAGFAYFALSGSSKSQELERDCLPNCTDAQVKPLRTSYLLADIGLGVGVLAGGFAMLSYVMRPTKAPEDAKLTLDIHPSSQGAAAVLGGKF